MRVFLHREVFLAFFVAPRVTEAAIGGGQGALVK